MPRRNLFCIFVVLLLISCGTLQAQETRKVRLAYSALSLAFLPHLVAKDAGLFQKQGLDVDLIQMSGPLPVVALTAGELDFGAAVTTALFAAARGLPLRGLMITVKTPLFYIVSDPSTKRLEDLPEKRLAVDQIGSLQHTVTRLMLKKKGVDPDRISYFQTGSVSNSLAALSGGTVSAALLSIPNNMIMAQKGFRQLASSQEAGVNYPTGGLAVHLNKLQQNRSQVKRMITALLESLRYIDNEKPWVISYIERRWKLTPKLAAEAYSLVLPTLAMDGKVGLDHVQEFLDVAYESRQIQQKAESRSLMDYALLDETLKDRRGR